MDYLVFWGTFLILSAIVYFFDRRYFMLRDTSTALVRPYSFARVQLIWWTVIILSSFISIFILRGDAPSFNTSTLYLLGISSATTISAALIDISDQTNPKLAGLAQNIRGDNFFLDMLSDKNGVDVHRFQTLVFNLVFGIWFIITVTRQLNLSTSAINDIIPDISSNNLILLGVSSGVYTALKSTENKQATANINAASTVQDESKPQG